MTQNQPADGRTLRTLLIEDSETDALLLTSTLRRGGYQCEAHRVHTREALEKALSQEWDLILADHSMPQFSAPEALKVVQSHGLDIPFIIVSGHIEEVTAVEAMRAGAHDYVMKDRLARLVPAVERELREAKIRCIQRKYQEDLRQARDTLEHHVEERTADLKRAKEELEHLLKERRRLENELLEIAENERRCIGFDLHDDLGQKLTGANMMATALEHKLKADGHRAHAVAADLQALIEQMLHHTHDLAHQFSALDAQGCGLCEVLEGLTVNAAKMFKLPVSLQVQGSVPTLPGDATLQLHKIAQEAVSNAIKHGKATQVQVNLSAESSRLELTIQNDGMPFYVPEGKKNRMGLRIMNYRANTIGATLDIKPLESGTLVTCSLPLSREKANGRLHSAPATAALMST